MIRSLWISKTGLDAQQTQLDVIANNLANVSTNGFKRSRAVFEDLLYQTVRQPGSQSSQTSQVPTGLQIGTGVKPVATARIFTQGNLQQTGNNLDLAINGQGFLQVQMPDGTVGYTRDGSLHRDHQGILVTSNGFPLQPSITIPANAVVYSDPADLNVPEMADLAVDLYLPGNTDTPAPVTMHAGAFQTSYISPAGNHTGELKLPTMATTQNWFVVNRVEVQAPKSVGGLVTFGDSITDGTRSTPDADNRWPDELVRRMFSQPRGLKLGLMNAGIAGNRVLSEGAFQAGINALARFDRDALLPSGVTHIVVMEGINDIGNARSNPAPSAEDIIAGYQQLIGEAHARGIKIYGATLTPFYGAPYYTEIGEAKRQAVNQWIRTGKAFDRVIDFDAVTRDPSDSKKLQAAFDSCDHLHPNDTGYKAMAAAVDLGWFK